MIENSQPIETTLQLALRIATALQLLEKFENTKQVQAVKKVLSTATQQDLLNKYSK